MRILFIAFLLFPILLQSQVENKIFIGAGIGTHNYSQVRIDAEQHLVDGKYIMNLGFATDLNDHLIQLRIGFRLFKIPSWKTRFYLYMPPYMNFNIRERRYNTPFCVELMKDWRIGNKFTLYSSINTDIFSDHVVPQVRVRMKVVSWKRK